MRKVLIIAALTLMCGCTRRVYMPVERVSETTRTDTVYVRLTSFDSVADRDTVRIEIKGDTVRESVTRWRIRYRDRRDTVTQYRTVVVRDSVPMPCPIEKVRKPEKKKSGSGRAFVTAGLLGLGALGFMAWRWRRQKRGNIF